MNKPVKVLSTAALAAVFASSALVPVIAQAEEVAATTGIDSIVIEKDGKLYTLDFAAFNELVGEGETFEIKFVVAGGKYFTPGQFSEAFGESESIKETAELLATAGVYEPVENVKVDGKVEVTDDGIKYEEVGPTPEENSIETFFYNLAA